MAKIKTILSRAERDILRVLLKEKRHLSINEISEKSGVSWKTVKDYIPKLIEKELIEKGVVR